MTEAQDQWLVRVLGVEPEALRAAGTAPTSKLGDKLRALVRRKPKNPPVQWVPSATPSTFDGNLTLRSKTEQAAPAPRTRTKLGIGERVELTASNVATWTTTAGTLSATSGRKVTLTAPTRGGNVTVTASVFGVTATLTFEVLEPQTVSMTKVRGFKANSRYPNATMILQPYVGPATVNFAEVEIIEDDVAAIATGHWGDFNGVGHSPGSWVGFSGKVVGGQGSELLGNDTVASGITRPDPMPTDWSGNLVFNIPWRWRCGTRSGSIATVVHDCTTDSAGMTTLDKGGADHSESL